MNEVAHWAPLVPVLVLLTRPRHERAYWLLAFAFMASTVADTVGAFAPGASWAVTRFYLPVQLALAALAFTNRRDVVLWVAGAVLAVSAASSGPDVVVRCMGSLAVLWLARDHRLCWVVFLYFGVGTVLYLGMVPQIDDVPVFMRWWYAYQGVRLTAFAAFVVVVLRTQRVPA